MSHVQGNHGRLDALGEQFLHAGRAQDLPESSQPVLATGQRSFIKQTSPIPESCSKCGGSNSSARAN
jgi:hypothetical protein